MSFFAHVCPPLLLAVLASCIHLTNSSTARPKKGPEGQDECRHYLTIRISSCHRQADPLMYFRNACGARGQTRAKPGRARKRADLQPSAISHFETGTEAVLRQSPASRRRAGGHDRLPARPRQRDAGDGGSRPAAPPSEPASAPQTAMSPTASSRLWPEGERERMK